MREVKKTTHHACMRAHNIHSYQVSKYVDVVKALIITYYVYPLYL